MVKSGTSMAAPRVSGAVALALERVPDLTNVQAKMLLCESARDLGLPRNRQGHGMLQTDRSLSLLRDTVRQHKKRKMKENTSHPAKIV